MFKIEGPGSACQSIDPFMLVTTTTVTGSTFRPFLPNNTRAYEPSDNIPRLLADRDAGMTNEGCRKAVMDAVKSATRLGFQWNAIGCALPHGQWPFLSDMHKTLFDHVMTTSSYYQRRLQKYFVTTDHARRAPPLAAQGIPCSSIPVTSSADGASLLRTVDCFGVAKVEDWGLPPALLDQLSHEINSKLDEVAAKSPGGAAAAAVVEHGHERLPAVETVGLALLRHPGLIQAVKSYFANVYGAGASVELSGYEGYRLSNALTSTAQLSAGKWHHDRCGARLKAFLYLHDVRSAGSRPTQVAKGSHRTLYWQYDGVDPSRFRDEWVASNYEVLTMAGPKGGGFLFDTNALHRAVVQGDTARTVLVLEFNSPHKDETLREMHMSAVRDSKHQIARGVNGTLLLKDAKLPCPSGKQHFLFQRL